MKRFLSLEWAKQARFVMSMVVASVLLAAVAADAAQPMRLPADTHQLRPDANGVARLPASCTRRDLPAPNRNTTLSIHNDGVQVVRIDNGVKREPVSYARAVENGWVDWPTGDEIEGTGSAFSISINVKDRPAGTTYKIIVAADKPAVFGDDRRQFDETLPIVERYVMHTQELDRRRVQAGVPVGGWESRDDLPWAVRASGEWEWRLASNAKTQAIREHVEAGAIGADVKRIDFRPGARLRIEGDALVVPQNAEIDRLFEVAQVIELLQRTPRLMEVARRLPSLSYPQLRQREQIMNRVTVELVSENGTPVLRKDGLPPLRLAGMVLQNVPDAWLAEFRKGLLNVDMSGLPEDTPAEFRRVVVPQKLAQLEVRVREAVSDFEWILSEDQGAAARLDQLWQQPPSPIAVTVDASSIRAAGDPGNLLLADLFAQFAEQNQQGNVRVFYGDAAPEVFEEWVREVNDHGTLGGQPVAGVRYIIGFCLHNAESIDKMVKALLAKGADGCVAPTTVLQGMSLLLVTDVLIQQQSNLGVLARRSFIDAHRDALELLEELERDPTVKKARELFPNGAYKILLDDEGAVDLRRLHQIKVELADPEKGHAGSADATNHAMWGTDPTS